MGPAPVGGKPLRAGPFLFEVHKTKFFADNTTEDQLHGHEGFWKVNRGRLQLGWFAYRSGSILYRVADAEEQEAYDKYVLELIVT